MPIERKMLVCDPAHGRIIVRAVFSIADGDVLLGIGEFFAVGTWIAFGKRR